MKDKDFNRLVESIKQFVQISSKTLTYQGRGQRIFSARLRPRGPFQLFFHAPKTGIFTRQ